MIRLRNRINLKSFLDVERYKRCYHGQSRIIIFVIANVK